jgi:NADH-quinone oxidoreductase subunit D
MSDERFRDSKLADSHLRDSRDRDSQAGNPQERDSQFSDSPFYDSFDEVAPGHTFLDSKEVVLNMGPQHPSTHGVLQVVLKLDGEKVNGLECIVGYLHRGIEKIAENRTWAQFGPFVDRLDYTAAVSNSLGYCLGVEKLLAAEVPKRGQYLRVILTELCRLASHQVWLGTHVLDIGAVTPLFYAFRDREMILNIFEKYCGARLTTHAFRIGGCRWDAYPDMAREVLHICDDLGPKIDEYRDLITGNRIWLQRTKGVGYISPEDCIAYAITGPVLRGSGISWDVRKAQPYSSYEDFDFDVPLGKNGDTFDRYLVRLEEMRQSIRIIRQAVEGLPEGPVIAKLPKVLKPPAGEVYHSIEAPKGELGYFMVSDGSQQPYRVRVRPPSFINLQALEKMAVGSLVADVVAIIGTLDIVLGEVDR